MCGVTTWIFVFYIVLKNSFKCFIHEKFFLLREYEVETNKFIFIFYSKSKLSGCVCWLEGEGNTLCSETKMPS